MHRAPTIAAELRWRAAATGVRLTPHKLHALLFLVQVAHLRAVGDLAFADPILAGPRGPVLASVDARRLPPPPRRPSTGPAVRAAVAEVLATHGPQPTRDLLRRLRARGRAWRATAPGDVIQPESLATLELDDADRRRLGDRRRVLTDDEEAEALARRLRPPRGPFLPVRGDLFKHFGIRRGG